MNNGRYFIVGVLVVVLLAMPVMAEMDATSTDIYTGQSSIGGSGIDPYPVLDGSAFTQYDTVFFHGPMAESGFNLTGVFFEFDNAACHSIMLYPSSSAIVICPYFSYDSKQGGIQPRVRYLGLQYVTSDEAEIYGYEFFNGCSNPGRRNIFASPLKSKSTTLKVIDLGAWYRFDRGFSMTLLIRNPSTTSYGAVSVGGYGARFEW